MHEKTAGSPKRGMEEDMKCTKCGKDDDWEEVDCHVCDECAKKVLPPGIAILSAEKEAKIKAQDRRRGCRDCRFRLHRDHLDHCTKHAPITSAELRYAIWPWTNTNYPQWDSCGDWEKERRKK